MTYEYAIYLEKNMHALSISGAAFAIIAASPVAVSHAYDAETGATRRPPQRVEQRSDLGQVAMKVRFSHHLQAMVADGKITKDQAFKLQNELDRFHERQQKDRQRFMDRLPEKTGISEDTLQELFAPRDGARRPAPGDWHHDDD